MSHSTGPVAEVETISPAKAHELLASKEHPDRRVHPVHVEKLADDIRLGFWTVNGESIKINQDGEVIDGQHRLHACIKADKPIETLVVRGLPVESAVQYTTDAGRKRSIADALRIQGESYVNEMAGAVGYLWRFLTERLSYNRGPSVPVALKLFNRFAGDEDGPGLRYSAGQISRLRHRGHVPISGSLGTWGYLVFGEIARRDDELEFDAAEEFWNGLYLGTDLVEDDPRLHLRNRFIEHGKKTKNSFTFSGPGEMAALTIKAWNRFAEGRPMTPSALRWRSVGPMREPFPILNGQELLEDWFRIRL